MGDNKVFRWIDESIDISDIYDKLPKLIKNMIKEAEEADKEGLEFVYYEICDNIEVQTKMLLGNTITHKEWNMICSKYSLPADA